MNPISFTCIIVVKQRLTWDDAKSSCEQSGDRLAVFLTRKQFEWIDYVPGKILLSFVDIAMECHP